MKITKLLSFFIVCLFCYTSVFASLVSIEKIEREAVNNKSQQQVADCLRLKMLRNIVNEATGYVKNILAITKDQKISEDVTNVVSALIQMKTQEKEVFSEDNEGFMEIKIEADVETDNVKFYVDKIKKDKNSRYKKEFEELRKEKLNLENRLRNANKAEYEKNLLIYTKNQFSRYKQKELEYNKIASQNISMEISKNSKQQSVNKENLSQQNNYEIKEIEERLLSENDSIQRAKLENKMRINNVEKDARQKMLSWTFFDEQPIEKVIEETRMIKKDTEKLISELSNVLVINRENLAKTYDEQINALKSVSFSQTEPVKDQWETTEDFNKRLQYYEKNREDFIKNSQNELLELTSKKEEDMLQNEIEDLQSVVSILQPFIEKLKFFQSGRVYDNKNLNEKAKISSLGEVNADEHYFVINVEYLSNIYSLKFNFNDIGIEKAKSIYENKNQFEIQPLFSIVENKDSKDLDVCLSSFNINHSDMYISKNIELENAVVPFKEIVDFHNYEKKLNTIVSKKEKLLILNKILNKKIKDFTENEMLQKFTIIIDELKKVQNITDFEKMNNLDNYEKFVEGLNVLNNIVVSVSASGYHTLGLKKDGTVVATGNNQYGQCNVQDWKNIKKISAGVIHSLGLQKDGTAVAIGDDTNSKCRVVGWETLVSISAGEHSSAGVTKDGTIMLTGGLSTQQALITNLRNVLDFSLAGRSHIISLKKDGTVEAIGDNTFGQCNVKNWKDIKSISVGDNHTVGLKTDGTVVAVGKNKESQCNVSNWKDIIEIAAGHGFTVGLKKDGTVVCTEQFGKFDLADWKDVASISAGWDYIIGIKKDGTIISEGNNKYGQRNVLEWSVYLPSIQ